MSILLVRMCAVLTVFFLSRLLQPLLTEFNKEQEAFIAAKGGKLGEALPPWVGYPQEEKLKEDIMSLSTVSDIQLNQKLIVKCSTKLSWNVSFIRCVLAVTHVQLLGYFIHFNLFCNFMCACWCVIFSYWYLKDLYNWWKLSRWLISSAIHFCSYGNNHLVLDATTRGMHWNSCCPLRDWFATKNYG